MERKAGGGAARFSARERAVHRGARSRLETISRSNCVPELPPAAPKSRAGVTRLRRYLIGLDLVGCVHEVDGRRVNIGRTRDNDLRIVDPTVSRLHAMLTVRDGEAMVVDANSRNGIFVNGIQVRYARLDDGDLVTFGTVRFRYRVGSDMTGGAVGSA